MCGDGGDVGSFDFFGRLWVLRGLEEGILFLSATLFDTMLGDVTYLMVIKVLSRVDSLIFNHFDDLVDSVRQQCAHDWTKPVDVVVAREVACDYTRPEASCGIQAASSVENTDQLGNEKGESDSDGRKESGLVLLSREHEDGDD